MLSILVSGTLLVTGWAGGELAYRHGIGVVGEGTPLGGGLGEEVPERQQQRDREHRRAA